VADDLTLGELGRRLEAGLSDIKDDLHQLALRLDGKVSADVLRLEQAAQDERHNSLTEQFKQMRADRDADAKRLQETRRWLVGVVVVPILAVLLPLLLTRGKL
jgi:hypothetical protein